MSAIAHNAGLLRARLAGGACLMAVVKANGYGHGADWVARRALRAGATALGVAMVEEGVQLREAGLTAPILVLGPMPAQGAEDVVRHDLIQTVFDAQSVRALAKAARAQGRRAAVHIKADTGMGRIGARSEIELLGILHAAQEERVIDVTGVYTHFATADDDLDFARAQHARFLPLAQAVRRAHPKAILHAANSAALLRLPEAHHDMARAGIALYVKPTLPDGAAEGFRQAMRWRTRAAHVKEILPGDSVSYGRAFRAGRPTRVMTLPVGYADGYHRAIGGRGFALVRGQRAPVIGRVCMDQAMLDVTDIEGAQVGDEVILLGRQGDGFISAAELGAWCGMIDYEVVLSPTSRVLRVYDNG